MTWLTLSTLILLQILFFCALDTFWEVETTPGSIWTFFGHYCLLISLELQITICSLCSPFKHLKHMRQAPFSSSQLRSKAKQKQQHSLSYTVLAIIIFFPTSSSVLNLPMRPLANSHRSRVPILTKHKTQKENQSCLFLSFGKPETFLKPSVA